MKSNERFTRQARVAELGEDSTACLRAARVGIVGCGALGAMAAERLLRAGVGELHLIDFDRVALSNLPRQTLYTEADVSAKRLKVEAAAAALSKIDPSCTIRAIPEKLDTANADNLLGGLDAAIDGLDNMDARFVLNAAAVRLALPFVHAGVAGVEGEVLSIRPGVTPCLNCLFPDNAETRRAARDGVSHGVFGPLIAMTVGLQTTALIQSLLGDDTLLGRFLRFNVWDGRFQSLDMRQARRGDCVVCGGGGYERL